MPKFVFLKNISNVSLRLSQKLHNVNQREQDVVTMISGSTNECNIRALQLAFEASGNNNVSVNRGEDENSEQEQQTVNLSDATNAWNLLAIALKDDVL